MARIIMEGNADVNQVAKLLKELLLQSGDDCELVDSLSRNYDNLTMHVMMFERYYVRTINRAYLTLVVTGDSKKTIVDAICTIAGKRSMVNFSWGMDEDFIYIIMQALSNQGFTQITEEPIEK